MNAPVPPSDFDARYSLIEPHETDPAGKFPPDFKHERQAALNACLRSFKIIQLAPDGLPVAPDWRGAATSDASVISEFWTHAPDGAVGGVLDGMLVLRVAGRQGADQFNALSGSHDLPKTAAALRSGRGLLFFFRLPPGFHMEVKGDLTPNIEMISGGFIELPSAETRDYYRWINRRPLAVAPQWLIDRLAALAASKTAKGNDGMGAGATAVEAFRKGQLLDRPLPMIVADQQELGSIDGPDEVHDDQEDKKDTFEIVHQVAPPKSAPAVSAQPIDPAVVERKTRADAPPAKSPRYDEAFDWIGSDNSPEVTDANVLEVLPKIAAELRRLFDLSLTEAIELTRIVAEDCDKPPTPAEIQQIVKQAYSADRASASSAKRYSSKLEAALDHARRGFRVLPLIPNDKAPLIKEWQHAATTDKERICRWFEENPDYNIGIVMDSDRAGVNVDGRKGGFETFEALSEAENLSEHATLTAVTASGSRHLIFSLSDVRLKKGADRLGQGIDLQTGSAYLVAPGSTIKGNPEYPHCDGEYQWLNDRPIAPMPDGLVEIALKSGSPRKKSSAAGKRLVDEDENTFRLSHAYLKHRAPEATEGNRNNTAVIVANEFYDYGATEATALGFTWQWNSEKCSPPLDIAEIQTIVGSALRSRHMPLGWNHPHNNSGFEPVEIAPRFMSLATPFSFPDPATIEEDKPLATPYIPGDPSKIKAREWLIKGLLCRRYISLLAGPAGVSKTTLLLMIALALVTGRQDILGMPVKKRSRVWFWNQEDPLDELERRLAALRIALDIKDEELADEDGKPMLYLNSGVDNPFLLAIADGDRKVKRGKLVSAVIRDIQAKGIDAMILDPLVEFHEAPESDNALMRRVMGFAREITSVTGCGVHIGTHTRKPEKASSKGFAGDLDIIRGASAQGGVARVAHTLLAASADDAKQWTMEGSRHEYVRLDMAKNNLGKRWPEPRWYRFDETPIGMESEPIGFLRPVELGGQIDTRLDILAAAMKAAGLEEARATTVIEKLPDHQRRVFGTNRRHWSREVKDAFVGPPKHHYEGGVLSWECSGERSPVMLRFQSAPSAQ